MLSGLHGERARAERSDLRDEPETGAGVPSGKPSAAKPKKILVVGPGPAGLACARIWHCAPRGGVEERTQPAVLWSSLQAPGRADTLEMVE